MNTLPLLLAQAADPMISGDWLIKIIGAVFTGAALILGRYWGRKEAGEMKLGEPVPEVPTRKVFTPPSWDAHRALADRVTRLEETTSELRRDLTSQYRELMIAGGEREERLSEKLDGIARGIHARIDAFITSKGGRAS